MRLLIVYQHVLEIIQSNVRTECRALESCMTQCDYGYSRQGHRTSAAAHINATDGLFVSEERQTDRQAGSSPSILLLPA